MEKSEKIYVLTSIILVGFVFGVFYHYVLGYYLKLSAPWDSFLYPSDMAFCDFWGPFKYIRNFAPYHAVTLWVVYFPLTYIILFPFALLKNQVLSYLIFISSFLVYFIFKNAKNFSCNNLTKLQNFQNVFILTVLSYPVLFVLDKGNFDMILFIIVSMAVFAFDSKKYLKSSILLGFANAIKPFSILFLILFLLKKKYKEAILCLAITGFLVISGFLIFKNDFFTQIAFFLKSQYLFKERYAYSSTTDYGMGYGSSLYMVFKLVFCKLSAKPIISTVLLTKIYDLLCFVLTIATLFFVCKEKIFWKQITLLTCNFLLLPYVTYDYKFIFLLIPIWLFVNEKGKSRLDVIYAILFAILFIPKNIIIPLHYVSKTATTWFSLSILINPAIMVLLTLLIIYEQINFKKMKQLKEV